MPGFTYTVQQTSPGVFTNCCCGRARAPLVINPWVGNSLDNGRPIHAFGGRMVFTATNGSTYTNYDTARAANALLSPATGSYAGRYSETFVTYYNLNNPVSDRFPGGASYANNTRVMTYRMAHEFPTVFNSTYTAGGGLYCGELQIAGASTSDGKTYYLADSEGGYVANNVIKLEPNGYTSPYYLVVSNCTNYSPIPPITGYFPQAFGSYLIPLNAERLPSIPGPTWSYATGTARQLCSPVYNANTVLYQQALGPVLLPADPNYNNAAFWQAAYDTAVAAGTLQAGVITRGSNATVSEWAEK